MATIDQKLDNDTPASVVPWNTTLSGQRRITALVTYALLIPGAILFVMPFIWMISTALKTPPQIFGFPPKLIPNPVQVENFSQAWNDYLPFNTFLFNSVKITFNNIIGNLFSCTLAAYAFARLRARGKNLLFAIILGTMVLPMEVLIIPQYILFTQLGWNNTHLPLMVPPWFGWAFFIFLLRQFFMTIPQELVDAALIDGAGQLQILLRIFLPLSKPALATVAIFAFIGNWNNFLGPLIYLRSEHLFTLPIGLVQFQGAFGNTAWQHMMAIATIAVIPVLIIFLFGQKLFIQGITLSGLNR
jgi:multiple sugar transport system permease protein